MIDFCLLTGKNIDYELTLSNFTMGIIDYNLNNLYKELYGRDLKIEKLLNTTNSIKYNLIDNKKETKPIKEDVKLPNTLKVNLPRLNTTSEFKDKLPPVQNIDTIIKQQTEDITKQIPIKETKSTIPTNKGESSFKDSVMGTPILS